MKKAVPVPATRVPLAEVASRDVPQPPAQAACLPRSSGRLAVLPIPLLLLAMVLLAVADLRTTYQSPYLLMALDFLCRTVACLFIAYLAGRGFLTRGAPGLLLLGCGVAIWGGSGLVATSTLTHADANLGITISNLGIWLAALCYLTGVLLSLQTKFTLRQAGLWLATGYTLAFGAVGLIVLSTSAGWLPVFFVEGRGGMPVRHIVLGSALAMFALTAVLLWEGNRPSLSPFARWYMLALLLIAVGILGMMLQSSRNSLLNWTCRVAQYLGGIYMLIAALGAMREPGAGGIALGRTLGQARYRYGVALAFVFAAAALRLFAFPLRETQTLFATFYPAVMLAALYGGFRAGLLATVLSAALADYLWMEPLGHFAIKDPADVMSLAIFLLSCTMISWITEAMHRARVRAASAEAEAQIAAERQRAAEALRQKEGELAEALRVAHIGNWYWDAKTDVTTGSDELLRIYGFDPASQAMPNFKDQRGRCYPVEDWERINAAVQGALETGTPYELDVRVIRDGVPIWVTTRGELVRDGAGQTFGLRGTVQNITERKQAEEALRESEDRFRVAQELSPDGFAILRPVRDGEGRIVDFTFVYENAAIARINGTDPAAVVGRRVSEFMPAHSQSPFHEAHAHVADTGETCIMERKYDGGDIPRPTWFRVVVVRTGQDIAILSQDITERKHAEERIQASLCEKEVLLQEIHHRVKNNLQVISSLVSLQAGSLSDDRVREALGDIGDRIRTISLVHEKLYQTDNLARLDFADYAASLLKHLWHTYGTLAGKVRLTLAMAPVVVPIESAVTCGLILNELAGNALKHAFPNGNSGEVTVGLDRDSATGTLCLWVRDNGVGLPEGLEWREANTLGLRLVRILAGQLRGTVTTGPGAGSEFRVTFIQKGI